MRHGRVLDPAAVLRAHDDLHPGRQVPIDHQPGDSGGPLLVGDPAGGVRQVAVTTLGADSTTRLYAGFTSIPAEADWIAGAIASLRGDPGGHGTDPSPVGMVPATG